VNIFKTFLLALIGAAFLAGAGDSRASVFEFAEHTPGYRLVDEGTRFYETGFYSSAIRQFERAAHWADKMAQHNLGVMHYLGHGFERDPARAWAWFELAAERDYPEFVRTADAVWEELDERQRERARAIFEELEPHYGDDVAIERTQRRMERERRNVTGSRTGSVGNVTVLDRTGSHDGEHYFAEEKWDFRHVIRIERQVFDALDRGNVTIGALELVDGEDESTAEDPSSQPDDDEGSPPPEG
jgi:hypothetical protein